jgi:hypothetical protein
LIFYLPKLLPVSFSIRFFSVFRVFISIALGFNSGCSNDLFAQADNSPSIHRTTVLGPSSTVSINSTIPSTQPQDVASTSTAIGSNALDNCNEQPAQEFLVRAHVNSAAKNRSELAEQQRLRAESISYRTKHYGHFEHYGRYEDNPIPAKDLCEQTTFFGIPVTLNRHIIPALKCVEKRLRHDCVSFDYRPRILSGLRRKNTYFDGEVSTHVYGIALDVDPTQNPCCHCVKPWSESPLCRGEKSVWERMSMPRCWVEVFERYGFYWLGHDVLEDTMHFEFLGDPERITRRSPP